MNLLFFCLVAVLCVCFPVTSCVLALSTLRSCITFIDVSFLCGCTVWL